MSTGFPQFEHQPILESDKKELGIVNSVPVTEEELANARPKILSSIHGLLCGYDNSGHLAEDLTQATMMSAWQNRGGFKEKSSLSTWLYAIARNEVRDFFRKSRTKSFPDRDTGNMVSLAQFPDKEVHMRSLTSESGDHNELSEEQYKFAVKFSETIENPIHRKIFLLGCEGSGPEEIFEKLNMKEPKLNIKVQSVKVILYRMREKLVEYAKKGGMISDPRILEQTKKNIRETRK